jgi:hypothetical protein
MAFRTFVDSAGDEWQAYDVIPRIGGERRRYDRRSTDESVAAERRSSEDRRLSVGRVSRLANGGEGWLCFERGGDRRRLSPIPENWERLTDEELDKYRETARPVPTTPGVDQPTSQKL